VRKPRTTQLSYDEVPNGQEVVGRLQIVGVQSNP
jgi:hypothetical protein